MINYYNLEELSNNCLALMTSTLGLASGENEKTINRANERIVKALRKIFIANEMDNKVIICISGLQGAGKTTMLKNYYGLDDTLFNIAWGRGERIPVFVCERKDYKEPRVYSFCLTKTDEGYIKTEKELSSNDDIIKATSGEDEDVMYVELRTPYMHFRNESSAFLLLPGFEKKNDYWRSLIEFSVNSSDTSVFVFNEYGFAKMDNKILLDKIHNKFGDSLIYAISRSDEKSDGNESVKRNCMEVMGVPEEQEDRVVCVGQYKDEEKNEAWRKKLEKAINTYQNSVQIAKNKCRDYVYDIIRNEIYSSLADIKNCISDEEELKVALEKDEWLKAFDKVVKKEKRILTQNLEECLCESYEKSHTRLDRVFSDKDYAKSIGIDEGKVGAAIIRTVFGENEKDIMFARKRVQLCMQNENAPEHYDYQDAFLKAVTMTSEYIKENNQSRKLLCENPEIENEPSTYEHEVAKTGYIEKKLDKEMYSDVALLLSEKPFDIELKHDPKDVLTVIAEIGTAFYCANSISKYNDYCNNASERGTLDLKASEIREKIGNVDKVILSTLGITGVDILGDGVLNAIPQIAESLAVSVPIVGTAVAAIAGVVTATAIIKDVNRLQRTEYESAENMIAAIQEHVKSNYLNGYDFAMERIRDVVESNLIYKTGINDQARKKLNAKLVITRIERQLDEICAEVAKDSYDIRSAVKA